MQKQVGETFFKKVFPEKPSPILTKRNHGTDVVELAFGSGEDGVHDHVDLILGTHDEADVVVEGDGCDVFCAYADPLARVDAFAERLLDVCGRGTVGAEVNEGVSDGTDAGFGKDDVGDAVHVSETGVVGDAFHIFHREGHGHEHHREGICRALGIYIVVEEGNNIVRGSDDAGCFSGTVCVFFGGIFIGDGDVGGAGAFADGFVVLAAGGEKKSGCEESYEEFLEVHVFLTFQFHIFQFYYVQTLDDLFYKKVVDNM